MKKTVVFDFDGVIHSYISGWQGPEVITDQPVPGIREAIRDLRDRGYEVVVVSTRCAIQSGVAAVRDYLQKYNIVVDDVVAHKPPAIVYIDDRAICFDGTPSTLVDQIEQFKPWSKMEDPAHD